MCIKMVYVGWKCGIKLFWKVIRISNWQCVGGASSSSKAHLSMVDFKIWWCHGLVNYVKALLVGSVEKCIVKDCSEILTVTSSYLPQGVCEEDKVLRPEILNKTGWWGPATVPLTNGTVTSNVPPAGVEHAQRVHFPTQGASPAPYTTEPNAVLLQQESCKGKFHPTLTWPRLERQNGRTWKPMLTCVTFIM